MTALRVGLVGAGPWAKIAYVPLLTGGPELELVGVWARRPEAAQEVAELGGTRSAASIDELYDRCDAVAFAVPPSVQFELAVKAAQAGKHLLLDKPVGDTAERADAVAVAAADAGVASLVLFTSRFRPDVRQLLAETTDATFAQLLNLNGAFLAGPFSSSPWRHEEGALLDWGPHGVDMLMAALGPVVSGFAQERDGTFAVRMQHEGGRASQALFSSTWSGGPVSRLDLVTPQGLRSTDWAKRDPATYEQVFRTVREEFAHAVRTGEPHPCDARRGADVQRIVDQLRASVAQNR
jgi:predicted dehydrogenase